VELIRLFASDSGAAEATAEGSRAPRLEAAEAGLNREVKLSPGGAAELLNVSETGLLVEGKTRLSTGSKVLVTLTGREQKRLTGRVVRCQVCAIHRDGTMTYQTALALDQPAGLENIVGENGAAAAAAAPAASVEPEPVAIAATAPRRVNEW
jgi:hypothetical protein